MNRAPMGLTISSGAYTQGYAALHPGLSNATRFGVEGTNDGALDLQAKLGRRAKVAVRESRHISCGIKRSLAKLLFALAVSCDRLLLAMKFTGRRP